MSDESKIDVSSDHWLVRPATITRLWWGGCILLAFTLLAEWMIPVKGYFGVDDWPAFGAVFGFFCCVLMVLAAKVLGLLVKRKEDYYNTEVPEE